MTLDEAARIVRQHERDRMTRAQFKESPQDDIEKTHFYCSGCEMWHLLKDVYCDEQMLCSTAYWEGKDPTEDLRYEGKMELEREQNEKS